MPSHERVMEMMADGLKKGRTFSVWRSNLQQVWNQVQIKSVKISEQQVQVDKEFTVEAVVNLGQLTPNDVRVQLYSGQLNTHHEIGEEGGVAVDMESDGRNGDGTYKFTARYIYHTSGERGLSVRVLPDHELLPTSFQPGLITWAAL